MEAILTSLISQLKNPWQYICVGLIWSSILYFGIDKQYLIPFIIASLGIAYLIEQIYTKIIRTIFQKIKNYFVSKKILKTLKNCSSEEKDFLHNRVYENNNELQIDMDRDAYFYEKKLISMYGGGFTYEFYKGKFDTKEKVIKFLRCLENKGVIKNYGNQSMIIPQQVWNILVKNADEIFKDYDNEKEN